MDLVEAYESVRWTNLNEICEALQDWDVDQRLYALAVEGGPVLLKSLYLHVLAETEWHVVDSGNTD